MVRSGFHPCFNSSPRARASSSSGLVPDTGSSAPLTHAWVNGAEDPVSGTSPELEEARALGELLKQGWKPERTIIYCFWDGEEPGLLGSTEWAETHAAELKQHAVAYINSDGNGRGLFRAEGSHSLENFVNSVMKDLDDPETK